MTRHTISPYLKKFIASVVRKSGVNLHGILGTFDLDANKWQKLLTSFKASLTDLCRKIAKKAKHIATFHMNLLLRLNSCGLIALDNRPDVRPIGIGKI